MTTPRYGFLLADTNRVNVEWPWMSNST